MILWSHPRLLNMPRHTCRLFVSSRPRCPVSYLFSPHLMHDGHPSLFHPTFKAENRTYLHIFLRPLHPIKPIQST